MHTGAMSDLAMRITGRASGQGERYSSLLGYLVRCEHQECAVSVLERLPKASVAVHGCVSRRVNRSLLTSVQGRRAIEDNLKVVASE